MNLILKLTDEQTKSLAEQIIAPPKEEQTVQPITKENLPKPPKGFHEAIVGPLAFPSNEFNDDILMWVNEWFSTWKGAGEAIYSLRIGSTIAKLNGLEPEEPSKQEGKQKEGWLIAEGTTYKWYDVPQFNAGKNSLYPNQIHVREILPSDPSQKQVEDLVAATRSALIESRKVIGYLSKRIKDGECVYGWKRETEKIESLLDEALEPFKKP